MNFGGTQAFSPLQVLISSLTNLCWILLSVLHWPHKITLQALPSLVSESLCLIDIISHFLLDRIYQWNHPNCFEFSLWRGFFIVTKSSYSIVIWLFQCFTSSWVTSGKLCFSRNLFASSSCQIYWHNLFLKSFYFPIKIGRMWWYSFFYL